MTFAKAFGPPHGPEAFAFGANPLKGFTGTFATPEKAEGVGHGEPNMPKAHAGGQFGCHVEEKFGKQFGAPFGKQFGAQFGKQFEPPLGKPFGGHAPAKGFDDANGEHAAALQGLFHWALHWLAQGEFHWLAHGALGELHHGLLHWLFQGAFDCCIVGELAAALHGVQPKLPLFIQPFHDGTKPFAKGFDHARGPGPKAPFHAPHGVGHGVGAKQPGPKQFPNGFDHALGP